MNTYKAILLLLAFAAFGTAFAQEEADDDSPLQAYLDFCLYQREAMLKKSADQLRECIEESTQSDFRFNDIPIRLEDISDEILDVDAPPVRRPKMLYTPDFVDMLLMHDTDYRDAELEGPALMRDTSSSNCFYAHRVLGPKQTGTYRFKCLGNTRLICVPSPDGLVSVSVASESGVTEPFKLDDTATDETPYTDMAWEMDEEGTVLVTVRNTSEKEVSFVLATE